MNEFVMVPVPADRVVEVYRLLASEPASGATTGDHREEDDTSRWSRELLERAYRESPEPTMHIFDVLSEHPGQGVNAEVLSRRINRSRQQMAGVLGAFGRRSKNRYKRTAWPFRADWDGALGMWVYTMDEDTAAIIREIRERAKPVSA